jgi:aryl-alcohol dehydrogenase-like predicted oxidoreductase
MRYRKLGTSELNVSEIGLGSWLTYGVGVDRGKAKACVDRAFDLGINFIDTANVYGRGAAESVLGELLSVRPRDADKGLSRVQIFKQIDASLHRLRVDHVDLYQRHRYDVDTPLAETIEALSEVVRQGKARYIGFNEWSAQQIDSAFTLKGGEHFVSSQPQYSILWRRPEEQVMPLCKAHGISQIVWSPLAQGVLSGKYSPEAKLPAESRASSEAMGQMLKGWLRPEVLKVVEGLKPLADMAGCTLAHFALAWVLRDANVASAIVGASRPEQLDENAAASGLAIDPVLFATAEAMVAPLQA